MPTDSTPTPLTWLSEPDQQWCKTVREFAAAEVAPRAADMDRRARLDPDLVPQLFAAGLMGVEIPITYGGAGRGLFQVVLAIEELARVDPAVAVFVDVQNALVASALLRHGTGDQKRRFLPRLAGGTVGAYAISEDGAGSDVFAMTTRAEPADGGYRLSGRKAWTTSAAEAGLFLVFARTDDRLSAFLVDRDTPGVSVGPPVEKLGIRASSTCELRLDEVRVPRQNLLGRPGEGDLLAMETLNIGKLGIAAQLVGLAQGALDAAVGYARGRHQFGEPVFSFQGVQFPLAALAAELAAARALLYDTVGVVERAGPVERLRATAMAKYVASTTADRVASQAVETFGGAGFTTAHPVEKFYRDVKVGTIYEGTSNMQLRTIASTMPGAGQVGARPW